MNTRTNTYRVITESLQNKAKGRTLSGANADYQGVTAKTISQTVLDLHTCLHELQSTGEAQWMLVLKGLSRKLMAETAKFEASVRMVRGIEEKEALNGVPRNKRAK